MTVKGTTIYITEKEIRDARMRATGITELEEALLAAGYELSVESSATR